MLLNLIFGYVKAKQQNVHGDKLVMFRSEQSYESGIRGSERIFFKLLSGYAPIMKLMLALYCILSTG